MTGKKNKKAENERTVYGNCETCQFYDWDEEWQEYICRADLDEDELSRAEQSHNGCPMYRFYDEYKSVHKQI